MANFNMNANLENNFLIQLKPESDCLQENPPKWNFNSRLWMGEL
jgi:hypothetical protein